MRVWRFIRIAALLSILGVLVTSHSKALRLFYSTIDSGEPVVFPAGYEYYNDFSDVLGWQALGLLAGIDAGLAAANGRPREAIAKVLRAGALARRPIRCSRAYALPHRADSQLAPDSSPELHAARHLNG